MESNISQQVAASMRLTEELEHALIRELMYAYRTFNTSLFKGALVPVVIELTDSKTYLGLWSGATRSIRLSRRFVIKYSWPIVLEVLKHEMAHQYVTEVLGRSEEHHGRVFREICQRFGIDSRAAGLEHLNGEQGKAASEWGQTPGQQVLQKIVKLLQLAQSHEQHEAYAAMNAAQRLMLKYNLQDADISKPGKYSFCVVGQPVTRVAEWRKLLASILVKHFFVEGIWTRAYMVEQGKYATVLELCGTETNLQFATYVHVFLSQTAQQLWERYQKDHHIETNREKLTFFAGVMIGFDQKLTLQKEDNAKKGLVWVGDSGLGKYFKQRYPRTRTIKVNANQQTQARQDGTQAGRQIVLQKPLQQNAQSRGNMLPRAR